MDKKIADYIEQTLLRKEDNITYDQYNDEYTFEEKEHVLKVFATVLQIICYGFVINEFTTLSADFENTHVHCYVISQDGTMDILVIDKEDSTWPVDGVRIMTVSFDKDIEFIKGITGCRIVNEDDEEIYPSYLLAFEDERGDYHLLPRDKMM